MDEKAENVKKKRWMIAAVAAILAAVLFSRFANDDAHSVDVPTKMEAILAALLEYERQLAGSVTARIAVGYGACKDIFVQGNDILGGKRPTGGVIRNHNEIQSWDHFLEMYGFFFNQGAAAERFCSNVDLFNELVQGAALVSHHREALGGNAPVMANRFAIEGANVLLAAKMTPRFREQINPSIKVTGEDVTEDDIHLILEYTRNEKWGEFQAPRANRFIVHSDRNNPTLSSLEGFDEPLKQYNPDLLVIGGLQMMDNYPFADGERQERLRKVMGQMERQASSTRVHFEMASFVDETLLKDLTEFVIPFADSLGMNEQELPNLRSMLMHGNISVLSDSNPKIAITLDQMRDVFRILSNNKGRPLTRLHLHTLPFQAIIVSKKSAWKNTAIAAAKASLTANRHVCASASVDLQKALLLMDDSFTTSRDPRSAERKIFNHEKPVNCWTEDLGEDNLVEICISPNLVCGEAKQTAGGGDNISAAGLVMQV